MTAPEIRIGDAVDLIDAVPHGSVDLVATDPPYAFGGDGPEHAVTATVAVVLRECALRLKRGGWLIVFAASSWRSQAYMVEAVRGILEPVRVATWAKPEARGKTRTPGWAWQTVKVIAMRKGRSADIAPAPEADWIIEPPVMVGRRAQLPHRVASWALSPFATAGGLMLDPFSGSGALPKAASECGMRALGFERGTPQDSIFQEPRVHLSDCDMGEDCTCVGPRDACQLTLSGVEI